MKSLGTLLQTFRSAKVIAISVLLLVAVIFYLGVQNARMRVTSMMLRSDYRVIPHDPCDGVNDRISSRNRTFQQHIVFAKVHKAASSTVHNILTRFALRYGLNVMTRMHNLHIDQSRDAINYRDLVPIPPGAKYDILCNHLIFNKNVIAPYFPSDSSYLGIIREPWSQFLSAFIYYTHKYPYKKLLPIVSENPEDPVSGFLEDPLKYVGDMNTAGNPINNKMMIDFGFPLDDFENSKRDQPKIDSFLSYLNSTFDFILIMEMFDESLILMRRLFNWQIKDVIYMSVNVFKEERPYSKSWIHKRDFSAHTKNKFREWAALDIALYDFFLREFMRRIKLQPPDFFQEVEQFKRLKTEVAAYCSTVEKTANSANVTSPKCRQFPATATSDSFILSHNDCRMMTMAEEQLTHSAKMDTIQRLGLAQAEIDRLLDNGLNKDGTIINCKKGEKGCSPI